MIPLLSHLNARITECTPPPAGAKYCDERVCLFVLQHISGTTRPVFTTDFRSVSLAVAVARLSSGSVATR